MGPAQMVRPFGSMMSPTLPSSIRRVRTQPWWSLSTSPAADRLDKKGGSQGRLFLFAHSSLETHGANEDIGVAKELPAGAGWAAGIWIRFAAGARPERVDGPTRRFVPSVGPGKPGCGVVGDRGGIVAEELGREAVGAGSVRITEGGAE